jgi:anaerobic magnesium-protoporphyrin IX monomethyl ester cyclase
LSVIKSFRIAFVQAPLGRPEPLVYPLGIATLAGAVASRHDVLILDPNHVGLKEVETRIKDFCPEIICLSIRNLDSQSRRDLFYYYLHLKTFISDVRSWIPNAIVVSGGSGFSLFPKKIMTDNPGIDLGVFLEADRILPDLLDHLSEPSVVPGVFYRSNDTIRFSSIPVLPAPEEFGRPDYGLLNPQPYQNNGGVGVQTKRGCPLSCIYCTYPHLNGNRLRMLPIEQVMDELKQLRIGYGIRDITFVDGVFNLPKSRTENLLHAMRDEKLDIHWRGWFTEHGFDRAFAELCRDAGCPEFSFSPDGFSSATLESLGKTIRNDDIQRIYKIAQETDGIRVAFNFFWNPPDQTVTAWCQTLLFAIKCKLGLRNKAGGVIFGNARIEPHTPLLQRALKDGVVSDDTNLLPDTLDDLKMTFYSNPSTKYLDAVYSLYEWLWKLKQKLRRVRH